MSKRLYIIVLIAFAAFFSPAQAQNLRLNRLHHSTDISTDIDDFFNYNQYEGTRWGLGLNITTPLRYDSAYSSNNQNAMKFAVTGAWGVKDEALKYGASVELLLPHSTPNLFGISYKHDIERAGAHQLENYEMLATMDNICYVSSRYSLVDRLSAAIESEITESTSIELEGRYSREYYLFNDRNLIYPTRTGLTYPGIDYIEGRARLLYNDWKVEVLGGGYTSAWCENVPYIRAIVQYDHAYIPMSKKSKLQMFFQGGLSSQSAPLSRTFDLSGTGGSYYFFRNSFMTIAPNTFMANNFAQVCLNYTRTRPLWKSKVSNPIVFAQVNAMWGDAYSKSTYAQSIARHSLMSDFGQTEVDFNSEDCIHFYTPNQGFAEIAAGIKNLFNWSWINIGFSMAYQLTPATADYHQSSFQANFAITGVASLIFME